MSTVVPRPALPDRRRIPTATWIAIVCCTALLLALAVGGVYGLNAALTVSAAQCPPTDFPLPAGGQQIGWHLYLDGGPNTCDVTWNLDMGETQAYDFYVSQLSAGDWHVLRADNMGGAIYFNRVSDPNGGGSVLLFTQGMQTTVQLHLVTDKRSFGR
jgi:hypothetical protein